MPSFEERVDQRVKHHLAKYLFDGENSPGPGSDYAGIMAVVLASPEWENFSTQFALMQRCKDKQEKAKKQQQLRGCL